MLASWNVDANINSQIRLFRINGIFLDWKCNIQPAEPPDYYSIFLCLCSYTQFQVIGLLLLAETIQTLLKVFVKPIFIKYVTSAFLSAVLCFPTWNNQN